FVPVLSDDGRYVGFVSDASNLVDNDSGQRDMFVHDRVTGATERVSVDTSGAQANGAVFNIAMSADGRYFGFASTASNMVAGDGNGHRDIFVQGPDRANSPNDITGDGDLNDTILAALLIPPASPTPVPPATLVSLCPADQVAVFEGAAAFLRPEAAGPA